MNKRIQRPRESGGFVLVVSLFVMAVLLILATVFLWTAQTESTIATNYRNQAVAFHAAEGGVESGLVSLRSLLAMTRTPTDKQLADLAPSALSNPQYTVSNFEVARVRPTPPYDYRTVFSSGPFAGLNAMTTDYRITAVVTGPRGSQAQVSQVMKHMAIPLFQFGAFYGEGVDFEVYAGPTFWFTGRVHANSNIHLVDSGSSGQFYDSYVTAAGNFYRHRKDTACCDDRRGNPQVKDAEGSYQYLDFDREVKNISSDGNTWETGDVDYWRTEALNRFGGKVQDSAHGVEMIKPPIADALYDSDNPTASSHLMIEMGTASDTAEMKEAKLYYEAGIRIIEDGGVIKVTDQDGKSVNLPNDAVTTQSFYDAREQKTVNVIELNVDKLNPANLKNGIVYVASTAAPTDTTMPGVRLVNGGKLPKDGLTVVSQNPVYIKGDYNKDSWGQKGPKGEEVVPPAAILADAITILSGNWDDKKGHLPAKERGANDTIVNAALAMGPHAEAKPGAGNGEFNNLIRFLEDWGGKELKYKGSIVALWHSQQATAPWRCCNVNDPNHYYRPPKRNWGYDTQFDTNPPPGTPMGILQMRGQWSSGG